MQVTSTLRQANVLRLRFQVGAIGMTGPAGPQGIPGPANSLAIGTVSTLPYGSPATANITGTPPSQTLDLGLPMGAQGPSGSVTDGDKGDIVVSAAGTVWTIDGGYVPKTGGTFTGLVRVNAGTSAGVSYDTLILSSSNISSQIGNGSKLVLTGQGPTGTALRAAIIEGVNTTGGSNGYDMVFYTNAPSDVPVERARITSAGQLRTAQRPLFNGATPWDSSNLDSFTGDSGSGGAKGLVPAPATGDASAGKVLDASGSFVSLVNKHMPMGSVVDSVSASFTTVTSSSLIIPLDDTKPHNTEGSEILSVSIAPKTTTNKLRILAILPFSLAGGAGSAIAALFRSGVPNAISATYRYDAAGSGGALVLATEFAPGTTSSVTLSVRIGVDIAARAVVINGITGPARLLGGASEAGIYVQEIKA